MKVEARKKCQALFLSDLRLMINEANNVQWSEMKFECLWSCVVAGVRHCL